MQATKKLFSRENVFYFLALNLGLAILAAGIQFFKSPNHFAMGGTSGLSIIAVKLWPQLNMGTFMLLLNAALVAIGLIFLGAKAMGVTIYSSFALSGYVAVMEWLWPMSAPFTSDMMLELCFAVILPAAGSALVFNIGASSGGTDILAMVLAKKTSLEIGKALLLSDFLIAVVAGGLYGVRTGLYCVLGLLVKALLVDSAIESINVRKQVTIVSKHADEICRYIIDELQRGATVYLAQGAFTGENERVVTTVLGRRQAMLLRNYIRRIDPQAFMTIVNSSETVGKGFRAI